MAESETNMMSGIFSSYSSCTALYEAVTVLAECVSQMSIAAHSFSQGVLLALSTTLAL